MLNNLINNIRNDIALNHSAIHIYGLGYYEKVYSPATVFFKYIAPPLTIILSIIIIIISISFKEELPEIIIILIGTLIMPLLFEYYPGLLLISYKFKYVYLGQNDMVVIDGFRNTITHFNFDDIKKMKYHNHSNCEVITIILRNNKNIHFLAPKKEIISDTDYLVSKRILMMMNIQNKKNTALNKA